MFPRFHDLVTFQCDEAERSSCLERNDHYIDDWNRVLEISGILDRQRLREPNVQRWPDTSVLAVTRRQQQTVDPITPLSSTSKGSDVLDSTPSSAMSWTLTSSPYTADFDSNITSPTTISQASISPTTPNYTDPTTSIVRCPACSLTFSGARQDALSNLNRHLRNSRRHNINNTGLKCPMSGCENKKRMRSDNLGPHLRKIHDIKSKAGVKRIVDGAKLSAGTLDSNGRPMRRPRRESTAADGNGRSQRSSRRESITESTILADDEPRELLWTD